jgi:hypothetical protein
LQAGHRGLLTGAIQSGEQLVTAEQFPGFIVLDDNQLRPLNTLIGREAVTASIALAAATDCLALGDITRLDDFNVIALTLATMHDASTLLLKPVLPGFYVFLG